MVPENHSSIAADDPLVACSETGQHFLFRSSGSWFAVPATAVRELTIAPDVVSVPGCHNALSGLCRQQSEFIPIIALDALLDFDPVDPDQEQNQLLTLSGQNVWAIRIAEAAGLETLDTLVSPESPDGDMSSRGIVGTAKLGNRFIKVLNPEQLYQRTDEVLKSAWSPSSGLNHSTTSLQGGNR